MINMKLVFCVFLFIYFSLSDAELFNLNPDVGLNVAQLIDKYDYPFENHTVITSDGYILELHRIPHGKGNSIPGGKGSVLMMPAFLCDSSEYVNTGENSFAFLLADQGYDVWLGNPRGTTWGRKHVTLDPDIDKKRFWNFSAHELGTIDVPTKIDHILATTGEEKIYYVGHSQGTALFFMLTSTRPEYNSKIRLMAALSPIIHLGGMKSVMAFIARNIEALEIYVRLTNNYEILGLNPSLLEIAKRFCNDEVSTQPLCSLFLYVVVGFSKDELDPSLPAVIVTNIPAGASFKQFKHVSQIYASNTFQQFDYGTIGNLIEYGQTEPPKYEIAKVTAPIAAYYAENDFLLTPKDAERGIRELPNVVRKKLILGFNHLDLTWGKDAPSLIFNDFIALMDDY